MPTPAWIVECRGCKCLIIACGIDPQDEHGKSPQMISPLNSAVITCPCCDADYRYAGDIIMRGVPKRNPACKRQIQPQHVNGAVLVASSVVAAIRLRGEPITRSPKLMATISDAVQLTRMVMEKLER